MAISDNFRVLEVIEGIEYIFSPNGFKEYFDDQYFSFRAAGKKITKDQMKNELAEATNRSPEAVRQWLRGYNGPGDLSIVKDIAKYLRVDHRRLLVPKKDLEKKIIPDFEAYGNDEKSVIVQIYSLLTDFIYDYVGNDDGNSYVQRKSETGIVTLEEMYEYFFNIYRLLDKAVLNISDEKYKKLHSIITECRTLIFYGSNTCPFLGSWLSTKERWINENPQLELLALVSEFNDIEEAFDYVEQEHIDALMDEFRKESGRVKLYKIHKNGKKSEIYEDFYYYNIYEIIPMELARTFGSLYKKDFPECFH